VTDRRFVDITDAEIEGLVRRLPGREPGEALRARVLAAGNSKPRRLTLLRPIVALGALAALVLLDVLALSRQDREMAAALPREGAAVVAGGFAPDDSLSDLDLPHAPLLWAGLRMGEAHGEPYLQLRSRLLERGEGG